MAPGVEGHQVRKAGTPCGQHGQDGHGGVDSLAVDEIPPIALPDHSGDLGCEVVVPSARPGRNTQHRNAIYSLLTGQAPGAVGGKYGYLEAATCGQPPCDLMDVRLD